MPIRLEAWLIKLDTLIRCKRLASYILKQPIDQASSFKTSKALAQLQDLGVMDPFLAKLPDVLRSKVIGIVNIVPESLPVFEEIYKYALPDDSIESRKIRKIDDVGHVDIKVPDKSQIIFSIEDASILSPVRKKLNFVLHLSSENRKPVISLIKGDKIELSITDLKKNVTMATFLPVAEKQNYVYIFINYESTADGKYTDPMLMTLNKNTMLAQFKQSGFLDASVDDFTKCIEYMRKQAILAGFRISDPFFAKQQETEENSSFHVECHRGTKEGTLYFLPDHVIFGFKKPILLFKSSDIESITYSSITRLTFNVTLVTNDGSKFEFSMIDQNEYSKIDEYVRKKQVKDKSMSEELKAKSKNKANQTENDETPSALEEAAQQLENKSGLDLNSDDDEEADQNFEAESDLSDGSAEESGPEEAEDGGSEAEDGENEVESDNAKIEDLPVEDSDAIKGEDFGSALGLEDIPIEMDDDDDDDDEEGSGVEYS